MNYVILWLVVVTIKNSSVVWFPPPGVAFHSEVACRAWIDKTIPEVKNKVDCKPILLKQDT